MRLTRLKTLLFAPHWLAPHHIAVKALTTADTVREDPTSVMVANAIGILTNLVKPIRLEVKDETLSTHHVFRTAAGSASYVDKNAVQNELENFSAGKDPL